MKPKDIFSLAVRLLGLFFLCLAVVVVAVIFSDSPVQIEMGSILSAALFVAIGWWMLGGASLLMERAYPSERSPEVSEAVNAKADS